ncbi:MAG: sigma-70 family RNA polymerase sigma factor [Bryobacteraceae bacterium]
MSDVARLSGFGTGDTPSEYDRLYRQLHAEEFGFSLAEFDQLMESLLERAVHTPADRKKLLDNLKLEDLLLARACANGHEPSWNQFLAVYRGKMFAAALSMTKDEAAAHELADGLYADLFGTRTQPGGQRISKLNSYNGRGSLEGWLRTVLAQEFVNRFRTARKLVALDEAAEVKAQSELTEKCSAAEQTHLAHATDTALASLSAEDRFLLAAYYLDQRTLAEIARMLRLHESSVSRRLQKITLALRHRIVKELGRAGIDKRAAIEMLQLDVRDINGSLGVSVQTRLVQEKQTESFPKVGQA